VHSSFWRSSPCLGGFALNLQPNFPEEHTKISANTGLIQLTLSLGDW
jgi:hypothetical protein